MIKYALILLLCFPSVIQAKDIYVVRASWCGPCKRLSSTVYNPQNVKELNDNGHNVYFVDEPYYTWFKKTFNIGITAYPTTVIKNEKVERVVIGGYTKETLLEWLK